MIPVGRDGFINPATGEEYVWPSSHTTETRDAVSRQVQTLNPVGQGWVANVRPIHQQGAAVARDMTLGGHIDVAVQHLTFLFYFMLSKSQSIIYQHVSGEQYECFIRSYQPQRKPVIRSRTKVKYVWDYTLELQLLG